MQPWLIYALLAAASAAMIGIFGKIGMKEVNSDLATALRSIVQSAFVVGFCWVTGIFKHTSTLRGRHLALAMIVLSGVAGGTSWLCGFRAINLATVSKVAPIDKMSMPLAVILAVILLGDRPSSLNWAGIILITGGAVMAGWKS